MLVTAITFTSGVLDPHLRLQDRQCGQRKFRRCPALMVICNSSKEQRGHPKSDSKDIPTL